MNYLVTGANRGIGLEFVRQLVGRGESVVATARHPDEAVELRAIAAGAGDRVEILRLDVSNLEDLEQLRVRFAERSLDVLINNAGMMEWAGALGALDYDVIRRSMEVNVYGPLRVVEAVLPALKRAGGAKIANLTSKMGSMTDNSSGGSYAYRMSKAALNMATRSMAVDLKRDKIIAFVMHPGWVQTRMGGQSALIDVETSTTALLEIIDGATGAESGRFWEWNGQEIGW